MIVLKALALVLLGSTDASSIVMELLYILGLIGIFRKCGARWWYALIPCYKSYTLGRCGGRDMEGRVLFVSEAVLTICLVAQLFLPEDSNGYDMVLIIALVTFFVYFVYFIRTFSGLAEVFGRKKTWILLWLPARWLVALIWGYSKKFRPQWTVADLENEGEAFFSGVRASVMDQGLTVNLEERTVRDRLFTKKTLLRDIHLNIKPGSLIMLLGGSGSGKTTLLNAINGYEKAKAEIVLNGKNVYHHYRKMLYEVGFVPQQDLMRGNDTIIRTLSDAATLRLPRQILPEDKKDRISAVMADFGLLPSRNSMVDKLSGGQRKRVSIAMEYIASPTLFILDEPDSGLDGVMAKELMKLLREVANQGKIVIVITHTPDRVADMFDGVIVLARDSARSGRLAFYGSIAEAKQFFERDTMEDIVRCINPVEVGGEGRADEFVRRYAEVQHA